MTSVTMEWESRLGRRLRVRDLYILSTVVKTGGMAKAARQLAMTQPSVSAAIANLEHMLGVRLLDRSPRGIEPTIYADAMLKRSVAVFDELKQSVKDVAFLADPTTGELRIGCGESIIATVLPQFIERFSARYPRVVVHVHDIPPPVIENPGLHDRKFDVFFARLGSASTERPNHGRLECGVSLRRPADHRGRTAQPLGASPYHRSCGADRGALILPPPDTWNYARRRDRHPGTPDLPMAVGAARPAIRHREPAGRRQQHRHRGGRACRDRNREGSPACWSSRT